MRVLNCTYFVNIITISVATLHSVCIRDLKVSIKDNSSTSLFSQILIFIFCIHVVFAERTAYIVKLRTI